MTRRTGTGDDDDLGRLLERERATTERFVEEYVRAGETEAFVRVLERLSARCDEWNRSIESLKRRIKHMRPANIDGDADYYRRLQCAMRVLNRNMDTLTQLQEERRDTERNANEARDALLRELDATVSDYSLESQTRLLRLIERANDAPYTSGKVQSAGAP